MWRRLKYEIRWWRWMWSRPARWYYLGWTDTTLRWHDHRSYDEMIRRWEDKEPTP